MSEPDVLDEVDEPQGDGPREDPPRKRLLGSWTGNILVICIATAVILAGVWVVNNVLGDDKEAAASGTEGANVSQVDLEGDTSRAAPAVGEAAAEFTALDITGEPVVLSDMLGTPTWLVFGATWCTNCRMEAADIEALSREYAGRATIVAIYVGEGLDTVASYADRLGLTYTQVADAYTDLGSLYRVMGLPTHVFIDAEGTVRSIEVGTLTQRAGRAHLEELLAQG